jgi:hypothetical protein
MYPISPQSSAPSSSKAQSSSPRRCLAPLRGKPFTLCKKLALKGATRCRLHGGLSTGPRTTEGKLRSLAGAYEGKRKWFARQRAAGLPLPGRPKGSRNRSTIARLEHQRLQIAAAKDHELRQQERAKALSRAFRRAQFTPPQLFLLQKPDALCTPEQLFIKRTQLDPKLRRIAEDMAAYPPPGAYEPQPFTWPARSPKQPLQGPFRPSGAVEPAKPKRDSVTRPAPPKPIERGTDIGAAYEARAFKAQAPVTEAPRQHFTNAGYARRYRGQ